MLRTHLEAISRLRLLSLILRRSKKDANETARCSAVLIVTELFNIVNDFDAKKCGLHRPVF